MRPRSEQPAPTATPRKRLRPVGHLWVRMSMTLWQPVLASPHPGASAIGRTQSQIAASDGWMNGHARVLFHNGKIGFVPSSEIKPCHSSLKPSGSCRWPACVSGIHLFSPADRCASTWGTVSEALVQPCAAAPWWPAWPQHRPNPNLVSPDGVPGTEPLTAQRRGNPEAGSVARPLTRFQVPDRRRHPLPGFMQLCGPKGGKPGLCLDQTRAGRFCDAHPMRHVFLP